MSIKDIMTIILVIIIVVPILLYIGYAIFFDDVQQAVTFLLQHIFPLLE